MNQNNTQQATLVRMVKKVGTKIDLAKAIIQLTICFNDVKLSETEITVLAYFMVYKITQETKKLIVSSGVCKNTNNVKTLMSKLKALGFIYKDDLNGKIYISPAFNVPLANTTALYLKILNDPK